MGLLGILVALGLLIWLAFRAWSVPLLAPTAARVAALLGGEPLLASNSCRVSRISRMEFGWLQLDEA
jgi:H+/gluconate symporter-like permease